MSVKAKKHESTKVLAISKLNSILDLVSIPLTDDYISDEEYSLIMKEVEKLDQVKIKIGCKAIKAYEEVPSDKTKRDYAIMHEMLKYFKMGMDPYLEFDHHIQGR